MARCGCGSTCACAVEAGDGVSISGVGTPANPWVISAEGSAMVADDTNCIDMAVSGTGSPGDPFRVSATPLLAPAPNGLRCTVNGLAVAPSSDAGNIITMGTDGRLYSSGTDPGDPQPVEAGCGLLGNGLEATPLRIDTGGAAWPYACDVSAGGGDLFCDPVTGDLKSDAPHQTISGRQVPDGTTIVAPVANASSQIVHQNDNLVVISNPSACREMELRLERTGRVQVQIDRDKFGIDISYTISTRIEYNFNGGGFIRAFQDSYTSNAAGGGGIEHPSGDLSIVGNQLFEPDPVFIIPPGGNVTVGQRLVVIYQDAGNEGPGTTSRILYNANGYEYTGHTL